MASIQRDLGGLVRSRILSRLGTDPDGRLGSLSLQSLLILYLGWIHRQVPAVPREIHLAAAVTASPRYLDYSSALEGIMDKIRMGHDLRGHLSSMVMLDHELDKHRNATRQLDTKDRLLADWGIHHLHLSLEQGRNGQLGRTGPLLFAAFTQDEAFLAGIYDHGDWAPMGLVETIIRTWPDAGIFHKSLSGLRQSQQIDDTERYSLRKARISASFEVDGTLWSPPGQSVAGGALRVADTANAILTEIKLVHNSLEKLFFAKPTARRSLKAHTRDSEIGILDLHTRRFRPIVRL